MESIDIIRALWDKNERGENLTLINFSLDYMDGDTGEVVEHIAELTTNEPLASISDVGGYATVRITYQYNSSPNFSRMRTILEDHARIMTDYAHANGEYAGVPVLRIVIRPMSLRGAMITATNPVFFNIQPHDPMYTECNELQMLFIPDTMGFFEMPDFDEEQAAADVRAQMTSERAMEDHIEKQKAEQEAYLEEREKEIQNRMESSYDIHGGRAIEKAYHGFGKDRDEAE